MKCPCGYFNIRGEEKFREELIKFRGSIKYTKIYICPRCGNIFTKGDDSDKAKQS